MRTQSVVVKFTSTEMRDAIFSRSELRRYFTPPYILNVSDSQSPNKIQLSSDINPDHQSFIILNSHPIAEALTTRPQKTSNQGRSKMKTSLLSSSCLPTSISPLIVSQSLVFDNQRSKETEKGLVDHQQRHMIN